MALEGKLRHPNRIITAHDDKGLAIIDDSIPAPAPFYKIPNKAGFAQCYVTSSFPVEIQNGSDLNVYNDFLKQPPGLTVSSGTVLRYVDMPPGSISPMHRTASLDYGVVLEGRVELILDSGETSIMERGDICVQRATMHAWRNLSETDWARMLYMLQPAKPEIFKGKELGEDYGDMEGVKAST